MDKLEELVRENRHKLLDQEVAQAERAIDYLRYGALAHQRESLRSYLVENRLPFEEAKLAVLKTVEDWIRKGYVAGPFNKEPLLDEF